MIGVAIGAGLVFARVSRPTARVLFSRSAVVMPYDGVPTLMFRAANQRHNQILEAQIRLTLARDETTSEGHRMRRFQDLQLARNRSPLFALTWTVMHLIGPNSPLHGLSQADLRDQAAEIIITLTGIDETFSQTIHARHSFVADDIHWDRRLADILTTMPDSRRASGIVVRMSARRLSQWISSATKECRAWMVCENVSSMPVSVMMISAA